MQNYSYSTGPTTDMDDEAILIKKREFQINAREFHEQLGERLRGFRIQSGAPQVLISREVLNITFQQLQKYEKGVNRICPYYLSLLKPVYGFTYDEIFGEESIDISPHSKAQNRRILSIVRNIEKITDKKVLATLESLTRQLAITYGEDDLCS